MLCIIIIALSAGSSEEASSFVLIIFCINGVPSSRMRSKFSILDKALAKSTYRFSVVICPVYEDPADQENSVLNVQNASPFAWSWLSTINRANTQVQKVR